MLLKWHAMGEKIDGEKEIIQIMEKKPSGSIAGIPACYYKLSGTTTATRCDCGSYCSLPG